MENIKKKLSGTIGAIVIAVVAAYLGFYVNAYQMREILAIEHIGIKPQLTKTTLSRELRTLVSELDALDRFSFIGFNSDKLKVFDDDEVKSYLEELMNKRKKYEKSLETYSSDLSVVTTLIGQETIDSAGFFRLSSNYLKPDSNISKQNLSKIQIAINEKIKKEKSFVSKIDEIITQLIEDVYSAKKPSSFQIDVILVNNGKTQALVRNSGELSFDNDVVYLKKKKEINSRYSFNSQDALDDFVIIKENSFASMTLVVDEYNNRDRMIDLVKREYLTGSRNAIVKIYNSKGEVVLNKEVLFRNDLEEERKVSLLQFIKQNYSEYANNAIQGTL